MISRPDCKQRLCISVYYNVYDCFFVTPYSLKDLMDINMWVVNIIVWIGTSCKNIHNKKIQSTTFTNPVQDGSRDYVRYA